LISIEYKFKPCPKIINMIKCVYLQAVFELADIKNLGVLLRKIIRNYNYDKIKNLKKGVNYYVS